MPRLNGPARGDGARRLVRARHTILVLVVLLATACGAASPRHLSTLQRNPNLDPGTSLGRRPAPNFTLTDQFGRPVSISQFRGRVVILAFIDSQCTTICPLTTTAMLDAKAMLGPAAARVQLLGVDANPSATGIAAVRSYSELHGMTHSWHFLTGSVPQLEQVWKSYGIEADIVGGQVDHTPALFVIDPQGRLRKVYMTQMAYTAVRQQGQVLADEAAALLPGHPPVRSHVSYAGVGGISPGDRTAVPRAGGGSVGIGPSGAPRLYLFFATWDQQVTDLGVQLKALDSYQSAAAGGGLARLTAVDEASVEPSAGSLPAFLAGLPAALTYPVAIDRSGRMADGYGVQDEPWLTLVSAKGRILWYSDVSTTGWPSLSGLEQDVHDALSRAPRAGRGELAGSPPPLARLHSQAGALLSGGEPGLAARLRALHGYPVVLNVWGSWCTPCRAEFGLLSQASTRYGRHVAFVGADVNDNTGDARSFLKQNPVSYPSYQMSLNQMNDINTQGMFGTPTTIFLNRAGRIVHVHVGQYDSQGSLDGDIERYANG